MRISLSLTLSALVCAAAACSSSDNGSTTGTSGGVASSTTTTGQATTTGASASATTTTTTSGTTGGGTTGGATTGTTTTTTGGTAANTVSISSFTFAPAAITAHAGDTITFTNTDSAPHTATSEAAVGSYVNAAATGGWMFDTGDIAQGKSASITIPSTVASGTVQHYFCNVHKAHMANPDPTITIQ